MTEEFASSEETDKTNSVNNRYLSRGVSASKKEVHDAISSLDPGLYPNAFCKILPDYLTEDPTRCCIMHSDGAGTKSLLAYLHYREFGDPSIFRGIAIDSLVMNIDDLACVGGYKNILISSALNRNPRRIPGEVLKELIEGTEAFLQQMREWGIAIHNSGGETADVPDLTPTLTVDSSAVALSKREDLINSGNICPDLSIIGLASDGQAYWEETPNSGIGSNGLTSARHDLLAPYYRTTYPETYATDTDPELCYCGPYRLEDKLPGSDFSVGNALLSPTRTYVPLLLPLLNEHRNKMHGLIHCSGGGQTKCLKFGKGVHFVKNKLFSPPPVFREIQRCSGTSWKEMYQVYNMGHRMEIYCAPEHEDTVLKLANEKGVSAAVIGHTETSQRADRQNHLTIRHEDGSLLTYSEE